jgi:CheY-like chemotaxis protein
MIQSAQQLSATNLKAFPEPYNILLVEDNTHDAAYIKVMLDEINLPYVLKRLKKGNEVLPYLLRKGMFSLHPMPDLILLDLGLPCLDGFEVLNDMTDMSGDIRSVPIVILTEYKHFGYLKNTHDLCIFDYLTKPCDPVKLRKVLRLIRCRE